MFPTLLREARRHSSLQGWTDCGWGYKVTITYQERWHRYLWCVGVCSQNRGDSIKQQLTYIGYWPLIFGSPLIRLIAIASVRKPWARLPCEEVIEVYSIIRSDGPPYSLSERAGQNPRELSVWPHPESCNYLLLVFNRYVHISCLIYCRIENL